MKHRRFTAALLALCMVLTMTVFPAAASEGTAASGTCGAEGDNLAWTLTEDGLLTIYGEGEMADFDLVSAKAPWSSENSRITAVTVEEGVSSIGEYAFADCINMTKLILNEGLLRIGGNAFYNCDGLQTVALPDWLEEIAPMAFSGMDGLTSITIPIGTAAIGEDAFMSCSNLKYIWVSEENTSFRSDENGVLFNFGMDTLLMCPQGFTGDYAVPLGVTRIARHAFSGCTQLTGIEFPFGVSEIGDDAFVLCSGLNDIRFWGDAPAIAELAFTGVTAAATYPAGNPTWNLDTMLPYGGELTWTAFEPEEIAGGICGAEGDNLTWVLTDAGVLTIGGTGEMADYLSWGDTAPWSSYNSRIIAVTVEPGVTTIGENAFYNCTAMKRITLPEGLVSIGSFAFYMCGGLEEIILPDSLEEIAPAAFVNMYGVKTITIPAGTTLIGDEAFIGCSLEAIWVEEENPNYSSDEQGVLFNRDKSILLRCPNAYAGSYTVPSVTATIGAHAFDNCSGLTGVEIPGSVTQIDSSAFFYDRSLTQVHFQGDAPAIADGAFTEVTADVYYPAGNETWTEAVMVGYGGTLSWVAYELEPTASGTCGENATWTFSGGVLTISGTGNMDDYYVGTEEPWHDYSDAIRTIIVEDGITSVGVSAFYAPYATKAVIGKDVKVIRPHGFTNCYHLAEVNLPEGLTTLEECAFTFCIFESLEIPASVTSLDPMAFYKCGELKDLTVAEDNPMYCMYDGMVLSKDMTTVILGIYKYTEDVVIPDFVTRIGPSAFHNDTSIKRLTIPTSVDYIGKSAFTYCHGLEAVYLEDLADWCAMEIEAGLAGPMSYTDALYVNGEQITELVIPAGVERIAPYTFHQCRAFTSITLPDSVKRVEEAAFARCTKVTSMDLGNGVTFIGDEAFGACESLPEVTIPASVTQMGDAAISYSKTLKKVTFLGNAPERVSGHIFSQITAHAYYPYGNPTWTEEVMTKDFGGDITWVPYSTSTEIASGWSGETTWVLADNGLLTFSGEGAMRNYKNKTAMPWYSYRDQITGVVLGEGITCIGDYAFYGLPNLTGITIPATVTEIGDYAFKNCTALDGVVLPEALDQLGESAFYGCSALTAIDIPASLWTVKPYTFKNCTALEKVTFHEGNLMKISDAAFYNTAVVNVVLPDCLDILDAYVFKNCGQMRYVTLPASLTEIREATFYGSYLVGVNLPAGVTEVGAYAFKNCANLHTVNLNEGLTAIGESAFYGCGTMYDITVPEGVTAIGAYAFKKCNAMTEVGLPESLVTLGDSAFYGCDLVSEITLGAKVETVGDYCFAYSRTLRDITFTGDAPAIGSSAFKDLTATAYYPGSNATWTGEVMQPYGGTITWTAQ